MRGRPVRDQVLGAAREMCRLYGEMRSDGAREVATQAAAIATAAGCSPAAARRALHELARAGTLEVQARPGRGVMLIYRD